MAATILRRWDGDGGGAGAAHWGLFRGRRVTKGCQRSHVGGFLCAAFFGDAGVWPLSAVVSQGFVPPTAHYSPLLAVRCALALTPLVPGTPPTL